MLGVHYHTIEEDARAEPLLREALNAVRNSSDSGLVKKLTCDHAITLAGLGKEAEAVRILHSAASDPGTGVQQSAECLEYLAYIAQSDNDGPDSLKYGELALARLRQLPAPPPALEATFL